jgi:YesN/AraC family two-component response regulator
MNGNIAACDTLDEIRSWFHELCLEFFAAHAAKKDLASEEIIRKMVSHIENNYQDASLTVEQIAAAAGLSPNYARTRFKDATGKSLSNCIAEVRFGKAGELLRTTGLPAGRIASLVGFENTKYFYGAFRKHFGMTPSGYREENKRSD